MRFLVPFLVAFVWLGASAEKLPEKFYGKFSLDYEDNVDQYLTAMGYNNFVRKMILYTPVTKIFAKANGDKFNYMLLKGSNQFAYPNISLGKEFNGEGIDNTQRKITFYVKGGKFYEKHVPFYTDRLAKAAEYTYFFDYFNGQEYLVVKMEYERINAFRYFMMQLIISV